MTMRENKNIPLMTAFEKHYVHGRFRISLKGLKYLKNYNEEVCNILLRNNSIFSVKISNITHNILLTFDEGKLSKEDILELVEKTVSNYSLPALRDERIDKKELDTIEIDSHNAEPMDILKNIVVTAGAIAYFIFKKAPMSTSILGRLFSRRSMFILGLASPVINSGVKALVKNKKPTADTLSASAIIGSLILGQEKSALSILLLEDLAELITAYTIKKTRNAIKDILSTGESMVWKQFSNNQVKKVSIEDIKVDDIIVVHPGEKISVDGQIIDGNGVIDESSITGEFMPVTKTVDASVFAGTIVKTGTIYVKAVSVGDSTAISRVIKLVEEAAYNQAEIQTFADSFSTKLVGFNFLLAGFIFASTRNLSRAMSMLVIDYSCCIRLSTAVAFSAAINKAAKNGILIKGSNYIEALSHTDTVIFDKTGTLTEGNPKLVTVEVTTENLSQREVVELAAAAEETSSHPLAQAILKEAKGNNYNIPKHSETTIIVSRGVVTTVGSNVIRVGNRKFMEENQVTLSNEQQAVKSIMYRGEALIYVARDKELIGVLGVTDPLRENMKKSINRLRNQGVDNIILLTGDLEQQAEIVARRMALDSYQSELMPEDKAKKILQLQSTGDNVLMVGDGVNDAPALAYANVGLALGSKRTDIAVEAADISIAQNDPTLIPATIKLSKKTMNTVKENFFISIGVNTLALVMGGAGLLPVVQGSLIHNLSTLVVVGNSLKILRLDLNK